MLNAALRLAKQLAAKAYQDPERTNKTYTRSFAIGDPQAPIEKFLTILHSRNLLSPSGRLAEDISLTVVGDYFDWGSSAERKQVGQSGLELLAWLAAHPRDQVVLLIGNHDLARVGELVDFTDQTFVQVHEQAVLAYQKGNVDRELEANLCAQFPQIPTAELVARDFSSFFEAQRELVYKLLRAQRLQAATAVGEQILISHAGITNEVLTALEVQRSANAVEIAEVLNTHLQNAVKNWQSGPLTIPHLHMPGNRKHGEGVGIFYHRPVNPEIGLDSHTIGTLKRRYDPRRLPLGLTQVIGHISDTKCRQLLGAWVGDDKPVQGAIRFLESDGKHVFYRMGLPQPFVNTNRAKLVFIDGQMYKTDPANYELLELSAQTGHHSAI